jgi:hypothetical protein
MTYQEQEVIAQIEQTCDEVRNENAELKSHIAMLMHELEEIYKMNCLGKTLKIAQTIDRLRK